MGRRMREKKNVGNNKENNRSLSNITYSKRCIVIIPSPAFYSGLFFDSQRNINFLHEETQPHYSHFTFNATNK